MRPRGAFLRAARGAGRYPTASPGRGEGAAPQCRWPAGGVGGGWQKKAEDGGLGEVACACASPPATALSPPPAVCAPLPPAQFPSVNPRRVRAALPVPPPFSASCRALFSTRRGAAILTVPERGSRSIHTCKTTGRQAQKSRCTLAANSRRRGITCRSSDPFQRAAPHCLYLRWVAVVGGHCSM